MLQTAGSENIVVGLVQNDILLRIIYVIHSAYIVGINSTFSSIKKVPSQHPPPIHF
jgi:hypothetical protein